MYTIDASVWVNSFDQQEMGHQDSRQLLVLLADSGISIIVPTLLLAEVSGAISRSRNSPVQAEAFAHSLRYLPNVELKPLTNKLTQQAYTIAARHSLRGADAVYAAVAWQHQTTLITLDREQLNRLPNLLMVRTPHDVLKTLTTKQ